MDNGARMVREDKDGHVIRRLVSPPAFPGIVFPWAADRPEHVAAQYPGADIFKRLGGKIIVHALAAVGQVVHVVKDRGFLKPRVQLEAANAEWIFAVLQRPCTKTIQMIPRMH
jgi:hypothetical protein